MEPTIEPAVQNVACTSTTPQIQQESVNSMIGSPFCQELEATAVNRSIDQESFDNSANRKSLTTSANPTPRFCRKPETSHLSLDIIKVENNFSPVQKPWENYIDL